MNEQLVLPCCWETKGLRWHAEQYPMTAYEWGLTRRGIRIDRFVSESECRSCQFSAQDHTVGWTYQTKVCLKSLARLHLWTPPAAPSAKLTSREFDERTYRIQHRPSGLWADIKADSVEEAVRMAGRNHPHIPGGASWKVEDCWVRQYTGCGWGKVRE